MKRPPGESRPVRSGCPGPRPATLPGGVVPAAAGTHISIHAQDIWGVWRSGLSYESGYANWCILFPTGGVMHDMPPAWFGVAGSARLVLTNGSGSGVPPPGSQVFSLSMKA